MADVVDVADVAAVAEVAKVEEFAKVAKVPEVTTISRIGFMVSALCFGRNEGVERMGQEVKGITKEDEEE